MEKNELFYPAVTSAVSGTFPLTNNLTPFIIVTTRWQAGKLQVIQPAYICLRQKITVGSSYGENGYKNQVSNEIIEQAMKRKSNNLTPHRELPVAERRVESGL